MVTAEAPDTDRTIRPTVALSARGIDAPDHLAGGVLRSLARPLAPRLAWGVFKTFTISLATFGVAPLLAWTKHLNDMIRYHRTQLWHLAEWTRLQTGHPDAAALAAAADAISTRRLLGVTVLLWAGLAAALVAAQVAGAESLLDPLIATTYRFDLTPPQQALASSTGVAFIAWTLGLTSAYMLHWLRLQLHVADVRRFTEKFNRILEWEGVPPVASPRVGPGVRPMWIAGAILLALINAIWGVPMMLAGAAQRRYITDIAAGNRAALAERVNLMLALRRPSVQRSRLEIGPRQACREKLCRTELPPGASFCPRCGTRLTPIWREGL